MTLDWVSLIAVALTVLTTGIGAAWIVSSAIGNLRADFGTQLSGLIAELAGLKEAFKYQRESTVKRLDEHGDRLRELELERNPK